MQSQNFPKLKEVVASFNRFQSAKCFSKVSSLKLLDLSFNKFKEYDELLCLSFVKSLIVLNLSNNPIAEGSDKHFKDNMKNLAPHVMLINPENISKVSCFENFKELAFSVGNTLLETY